MTFGTEFLLSLAKISSIVVECGHAKEEYVCLI